MPRPVPFPSATAALALALFAASGLSACGDGRAADEIPPVVLTERDGVMRGPGEGATPVDPPSPARAGDTRTEPEAPREDEAPPTVEDDEPDPPRPAPNDDDADDGDEGEAEVPEADEPPEADDDAGDDEDDDEDDGDNSEDGDEDGDEDD